MLLTPKGGSHRDLLPHQKNLGISASGGNLVETEESTRNFTDSWKGNLLKQKKPNANGIQCYDPRLNRDIVKHMGKVYEEHIKVDTTSTIKRQPVGESRGATDTEGNPLLLPALEGHQFGVDSHGEGADVFKYPERRKAPHRSVADALTPPVLNNMDGPKRQSGKSNLGTLHYIETEVPKPLSPSSVAQKLRRYKIGLSPQQKVKNLIDDMSIQETRWQSLGKQGFSEYGGLENVSGKREVKVMSSERAAVQQSSPFRDNESFWDESEINSREANHSLRGANVNGAAKPRISDGMYEEVKNVFPHLNRSQLDQLSNEDFLFLRQTLRDQGFIEATNGPSSIENIIVDKSGRIEGGNVDDPVLNQHTQSAPSFTDSTVPGSLSHDAYDLHPRQTVDAYHTMKIETDDDQADFIYEDVSHDVPGVHSSKKKQVSGARTVDGVQIGEVFDDESSQEEEAFRRTTTFSNSSYGNSFVDFRAPDHGDARMAIGMDRYPSADAERTTSEGEKSQLESFFSLVVGPGKRGQHKLPPYKWTEAESRQNLEYLHKSRRRPQCHHCSKDGELWCDQCKTITCYNCWGIEDHHNTWEASVAFAADHGRVEKIQTLRGAQLIQSRKQTMEKNLKRLLSAGPQYSLLSGHNVLARKKVIDPEEALAYAYSPSPNSSVTSPNDVVLRAGGTPKSTLTGNREDNNLGHLAAIDGVCPPDSSSSVDLFLTGLSALSLNSQGNNSTYHRQFEQRRGEEGAPDVDGGDDERNGESVHHVARVILSARVPSGANTVTEEPDEDVNGDGNNKDLMDERSLQLTVDGSTDGTEGKKVDGTSATDSPINRPLTAMTDHMPDVEDSDSQIFNSYSRSHERRDGRKVVSVVNADQLYYKNAMSPVVNQKTGKFQRRLNDNYIEYDEMNVIHYSPAKNDPMRVSFLDHIHKNKLDITAERTKGYGHVLQKQHARALHISHKVKKQVHEVLAAKKELLRHGDDSPTKQIILNDGGSGVIKIGKKSDRAPLHIPNTSNPAEEAVEAFSVSPLNKKLAVPEVNADGTGHRRPPNPREVFLRGKAKKDKKEQESTSRKTDLRATGEQQQDEQKEVISEYGDNDDEDVEASIMFEMVKGDQVLSSGQNTGGAEQMRSSHDTDAGAMSGATPSSKSVSLPDEWGWNRMRGRSANQGNFPSLPFRGPPYTFDMKTDVHDNTIHRVFSPHEQSRTISKLTSLW